MVIVVMGVAGSGKTTVGKILAKQLSWDFVDADDFHPVGNITKISQGIALNDLDRQPWLMLLANAISGWLDRPQNVVLACSALKANYRQMLNLDSDQVKWVYLKASRELILDRLLKRQAHFMSARLLDSQFADLEEPETAIKIDLDAELSQDPESISQQIIEQL